MAKKRSRRPATPAQMEARARFAALYGGKKVRANGKKKKRAAKKAAAKKVARKHRKNPSHKASRKRSEAKARRHAAGILHSKMRRNEAAKKPAAAKKAAAKPAAPKRSRAQKSADKTLGAAAAAQSPQKPKRTRKVKTPAQIAADKARRAYREKNADKIKTVTAALKKAREELKAIPKGKRPKKGEKIGKRSAKRRILQTKKSALNLTRSALIGSLSPDDRKILQGAGLMRANPGFGEIFKDFVAIAPQVGVHAVALAGVAVAGQKIGDMVAKRMPTQPFIAKHAVTIGSVAAAIGAYELVKHASPKTRPFAGAVLMGGLAAAFVHAAARASWGSKLGLPFAPAPAAMPAAAAPVSGYINVDGQALAVDGMGEYMALSGSTLTGSSLGEYMALSGSTLTGSSLGGMGEYMALSGSTLTGSSLGEIGQMSEGRQGARALNSPGDVPVEDFMDEEEDEGSLSGSIFDD